MIDNQFNLKITINLKKHFLMKISTFKGNFNF